MVMIRNPATKKAMNFEVKKAIDDMVSALLKEKEDEIKHRDFCVNGLHENEKETTKQGRDIADSEAVMDQLAAAIQKGKDEVVTLKEEITEMQKQLKRAGKERRNVV
jgi:hypothetical protein